jgi:hypothetical protein
LSALTIVNTTLLDAPGVTSLVGTKVYPVVSPAQTAPPVIVVNRVSGDDDAMLSGAMRYYRNRMQVDCIAVTAKSAEQIGEAVLDALNGVVKATIAGCMDVDILFASTDQTDFADDRSIFRRLLQFNVRWRKMPTTDGLPENVLVLGGDTLTLGDEILTLGN